MKHACCWTLQIINRVNVLNVNDCQIYHIRTLPRIFHLTVRDAIVGSPCTLINSRGREPPWFSREQDEGFSGFVTTVPSVITNQLGQFHREAGGGEWTAWRRGGRLRPQWNAWATKLRHKDRQGSTTSSLKRAPPTNPSKDPRVNIVDELLMTKSIKNYF